MPTGYDAAGTQSIVGKWAGMHARATIAAYAWAHFGKSLLWHCSGLFFAFYLTEVAGFSPQFMGAVLGLSLVLNAVCDLGFGAVLGRWVHDLRSAAFVQAAGAVVAGAAFVGFAALALWPPGLRDEAAITSLMLFRVGYSLLDVPQNTVLAFISTHDVQRTRVASLRYIASGLALLLVTAALAPWLTAIAPEDRAQGFFRFAQLLAPVTIVSAVTLWAVVACLKPSRETVGAPRPGFIGAGNAKAAGIILPLVSIVLYSGFMPLFTKLEAYFVAYAADAPSLGYFMIAAACGQVVGQFGWIMLAGRLELLQMYRGAAAALLVSSVAFAIFAPLGGWGLIALAVLFGVTSTGLLATIWALMARAAAARPEKATLRFGQLTFCSKMAQAAGIYVLGQVLAQVRYTEAASQDTLIWTMAFGPIVIAMACSAVGAMLHHRGSQVDKALVRQ